MNLATQLLRRDDYKLGDLYGMRFHPILKRDKMHDGIDIKTYDQKWPIYSLEHGVIDGVGYDKSAGNYVRIKYRRIGYLIRLFHLDSYNVKKGDLVSSRTLLGYVGTTGGSTGVHLHIGVQRIGKSQYIDPMLINYIPPEEERLEEDGTFGPRTFYKLQLYYNQFPDCLMNSQINPDLLFKFVSIVQPGVKGSLWVKSVQRDLGLIQDGLLGKQTIMAMQRATGAPVTGIIRKLDDPMIRELQRRLNNNERLWG